MRAQCVISADAPCGITALSVTRASDFPLKFEREPPRQGPGTLGEKRKKERKKEGRKEERKKEGICLKICSYFLSRQIIKRAIKYELNTYTHKKKEEKQKLNRNVGPCTLPREPQK